MGSIVPSILLRLLEHKVLKYFPGCNIEENINYKGGDLGDPVRVESKEACAQHSLTNEEALFWTFEGGNCWLKKSTAGRTEAENAVSGNRECGIGKEISK